LSQTQARIFSEQTGNPFSFLRILKELLMVSNTQTHQQPAVHLGMVKILAVATVVAVVVVVVVVLGREVVQVLMRATPQEHPLGPNGKARYLPVPVPVPSRIHQILVARFPHIVSMSRCRKC